jgi:hypothetical protein
MFVLLQVYPPEASDGEDDRCCCLDVIAVDASEAELERYLAGYRRRYAAACQAFDARDNLAEDWGPVHDYVCYELRDRYQVYGSLIAGTKFKIVECLGGGWPVSEREPRAPASPRAHG